MKRLLLLVIVMISCFTMSMANFYPITPRPLRKLIIESEYIIHGKVIRLGNEKPPKTDRWRDADVAFIVVREVLQGKLTMDTIKVYYSSGMICPAPPVYIEGEDAIIFLDRQDTNKPTFVTHALSYGVKNGLGQEGIDTYRQRIREMQTILQIADASKQETATLDWLVTCTLNKYTRWEGIYELSPPQ